MQVLDVQTQQQVFFMVDRWLAVEEDDGMVGALQAVSHQIDTS